MAKAKKDRPPRLPADAQLWVVTQLACFESPSVVRKVLKDEWSLEVSLQAITYYDPTTATGRALNAELRELFERTREGFLDEAASVPIASTTFRLRELQRLYLANRDRNPTVAADLLKQAAQERGGAFTNRRELTGAGGGAIKIQEQPPDLTHLTDAELDAWERLIVKTTNPGGGAGGEAPTARGAL